MSMETPAITSGVQTTPTPEVEVPTDAAFQQPVPPPAERVYKASRFSWL